MIEKSKVENLKKYLEKRRGFLTNTELNFEPIGFYAFLHLADPKKVLIYAEKGSKHPERVNLKFGKIWEKYLNEFDICPSFQEFTNKYNNRKGTFGVLFPNSLEKKHVRKLMTKSIDVLESKYNNPLRNLFVLMPKKFYENTNVPTKLPRGFFDPRKFDGTESLNGYLSI